MAGPKAPKDPAKKRQGFYIMRNKQVSGSAQPRSEEHTSELQSQR